MKPLEPDGLRLIACDGDLLPHHRDKLNEYADELERRMTDTPHKQSWDEWAASEDGEDCLNICTLESAKSQDDFARYLRNRLKTAYEAGYLAAIKYAGAELEIERHRLEHHREPVQ